jgi:hypothetical protein
MIRSTMTASRQDVAASNSPIRACFPIIPPESSNYPTWRVPTAVLTPSIGSRCVAFHEQLALKPRATANSHRSAPPARRTAPRIPILPNSVIDRHDSACRRLCRYLKLEPSSQPAHADLENVVIDVVTDHTCQPPAGSAVTAADSADRRRSRCGTMVYLGSVADCRPAWKMPHRVAADEAIITAPDMALSTRLRLSSSVPTRPSTERILPART